MTTRQVRALRGVAAAGVTTLIAAAAHTLGGAGAPSPLLVVAAAVLSTPLATALVGRRPSVARVAAAVLAAQAVFHIAFALFGADGGIVYSPMDHATHQVTMSMSGTGMAAHGLLPDEPMLVAHLLAALATIFVLHRGEGMLRALARGIRRLIPTPSVPDPRPLRGARAALVADPPHLLPTFRSALSRRGPPLALR